MPVCRILPFYDLTNSTHVISTRPSLRIGLRSPSAGLQTVTIRRSCNGVQNWFAAAYSGNWTLEPNLDPSLFVHTNKAHQKVLISLVA